MTTTMTTVRFLLWSLAGLLLQSHDTVEAFPCPDVDDSCMNRSNWKQCKALEESGCRTLEVMESCPLQFACGDKTRRRKTGKKGKKMVGGGKKSMGKKGPGGGGCRKDPSRECDVIVKSECIGECRNRALQGKEEEEVFTESSLTYRVPDDSKCARPQFCAVAVPDALCQMISASATVYVDNEIVAQDVAFSDMDDSVSFHASAGSTIHVLVRIKLDPLIFCIRLGSYSFYLATTEYY